MLIKSVGYSLHVPKVPSLITDMSGPSEQLHLQILGVAFLFSASLVPALSPERRKVICVKISGSFSLLHNIQ